MSPFFGRSTKKDSSDVEMRKVKNAPIKVYKLGEGKEVTAMLVKGHTGTMMQHWFEKEEDAKDFLHWLTSESSPLTDAQKKEIQDKKVKVTNTEADFHHDRRERNFFRVRVSMEQFDKLSSSSAAQQDSPSM